MDDENTSENRRWFKKGAGALDAAAEPDAAPLPDDVRRQIDQAERLRLITEQAAGEQTMQRLAAEESLTSAISAREAAEASAANQAAAAQEAFEARAEAERLAAEALALWTKAQEDAAAEVAKLGDQIAELKAARDEALAALVAETAARAEAEATAAEQARLAAEAHAERATAERSAAEAAETVEQAHAAAQTSYVEAEKAHTARAEAEAAAHQQALAAGAAAAAEQSAVARAEAAAEQARAAEAQVAAHAEDALGAHRRAEEHATKADHAHEARLAAEASASEALAAREAAENETKQAHVQAAATAQSREAAEARTTEVLAEIEDRAAKAQLLVAEANAARMAAEALATDAITGREEAEAKLEANVIDRQAVEASVRHQTELVEQALRDRLAAEHRATTLANELADLRALVLDALRSRNSKKTLTALEHALLTADSATLEASVGSDDGSGVTPPSLPRSGSGLSAAGAAPEPSSEPIDTPQSAWAAAAEIAHTGMLPRITPELIAQATTRDLSAEGADGSVTIDDSGVLVVTRSSGRVYTFDLYATGEVEVRTSGKAGSKKWSVELRTANQPAVELDAKTVDTEALSRELQRWRPSTD